MTTAGTLNGVNVTKIANDAILRNEKEKSIVIRGKNIFQNLKAAEVRVHGNAAVSDVNKINIAKINSSIVRKKSKGDYIIKGKKTFFGGLETNHLYVSSYFALVYCYYDKHFTDQKYI